MTEMLTFGKVMVISNCSINFLRQNARVRTFSFAILLGASALLLGCGLGTEKGLGSWDCDPCPRKAKLAMKIGGQYLVSRIGRHEWEKFASEHHLDKDGVADLIVNMTKALPDIVKLLDQEMRQQAISNATTEKLTQSLVVRSQERLAQMEA